MTTIFFAIDHGVCEKILCEYLSKWLRLEIIPVCKENGTETISMKGSVNYFTDGPFKDIRSLNRYYRNLPRKRNTGHRKTLHIDDVVIFAIVDVDCDGRSLKSFRSKDMFYGSELLPSIRPIVSNPNLDRILEEAGFTIGERGKPETYRRIFDSFDSVDELCSVLKELDTDIPKMIEELKRHCPSFQ